MERVPGELMETLTSGQRAATRMILKRPTVSRWYRGMPVWVRPPVPGGDVSREHAAGE